MKKTYLFAVFLFLGAAAVFELNPAIEQAHSFVSLENYKDSSVDCRSILNDRPWYGKINHWFFLWIALVPAFIFLASPRAAQWLRNGRIVLSVAACTILLNLAVRLQWEIRNAPFQHDPYHPDPLNGWRMDCLNNGDGFSLLLAAFLSWIPAAIYTGLWLFLWGHYHRRWTKKITTDYKPDIASSILSFGMKSYLLIIVLYLLTIALFEATMLLHGEPPFHKGIIGFLGFFIVRPLLIPFEIFNY
jgi:hypothetical protein